MEAAVVSYIVIHNQEFGYMGMTLCSCRCLQVSEHGILLTGGMEEKVTVMMTSFITTEKG